MVEAIDHFTTVVKVWNKEVFGNIFKRKTELLKRIKGIQRLPNPSLMLRDLELELVTQFNDVLKQEEILRKQKSVLPHRDCAKKK